MANLIWNNGKKIINSEKSETNTHEILAENENAVVERHESETLSPAASLWKLLQKKRKSSKWFLFSFCCSFRFMERKVIIWVKDKVMRRLYAGFGEHIFLGIVVALYYEHNSQFLR